MHAATFITVLIVVLAAAVHFVPLVGEAQQAASLPPIGLRSPISLSDPRTPRFLDAFRRGLRELGYVEGQNIVIESRWAEGQSDRLRDLAAELVRFCASDPGCKASASLARPGGNLTGFSLLAPELVGKRHAQERSRMARKAGRTLISAA
jgi:putative ABC transport system substrate-binding protein